MRSKVYTEMELLNEVVFLFVVNVGSKGYPVALLCFFLLQRLSAEIMHSLLSSHARNDIPSQGYDFLLINFKRKLTIQGSVFVGQESL